MPSSHRASHFQDFSSGRRNRFLAGAGSRVGAQRPASPRAKQKNAGQLAGLQPAGADQLSPCMQQEPYGDTNTLRVLLVLEANSDGEPVLSALRSSGLRIHVFRAATEREFLQRLTPQPDVVISDYQLEDFSALRALRLLQTLNLDIPLLLVSGPIGEEQVALALKCGVDDYLLSGHLERIGQAILSAMRARQLQHDDRLHNEDLTEREERFRTCIEQMPDGLAMLSTVRTNSLSICGFHIDYLNEVARRPVPFLRTCEPGNTIRAADTRFLQDGLFNSWQRVAEHGQPDEQELLSYQTATDSEGVRELETAYNLRAQRMGDGLLVTWRDITAKKKAEEKMNFLSTHDSLTGVFNRLSFTADMERLSRSRQFPISVLAADVDDFKTANERLGIDGGDELLRRAATVLASAFRAEDMVARTGGDEFAVLLPRTASDAAEKAVERVRLLLSLQDALPGGWRLALSIGLATAEPGDDLAQVYRLAEQRMRAGKTSR